MYSYFHEKVYDYLFIISRTTLSWLINEAIATCKIIIIIIIIIIIKL